MENELDEDNGCEIYVNGPLMRGLLYRLILDALHGRRDERGNAYLDTCEILIFYNDEYCRTSAKNRDDGFLFYKYRIEICMLKSADREGFIKQVSELLELLWTKGYRAVTVSDFDHELPRHGGYGFTG